MRASPAESRIHLRASGNVISDKSRNGFVLYSYIDHTITVHELKVPKWGKPELLSLAPFERTDFAHPERSRYRY